MNRSKGLHLTNRQKLLIYKGFRYDENPINQIWQKYDASISTVKRIIREFNANMKREEIYSKIRSKKIIWPMVVEEWISESYDQKLEDSLHWTFKKIMKSYQFLYQEIKCEIIWNSAEI